MRTRLRLPVVLLSCSLFFLAGFFGSLLFTQDPEEADMPVPRERLLEAAWPEMPYGESGEAAPSLIPYQILSWQPRALYFPQFATSEQCENIVKTAKERLKPSTLALRKGETAESTKGIRTSHLMSCGIILDKGMLHIMTRLTQLSMVHKKIKGWHLSCFILRMSKKGEKLCSHTRTVRIWI